MGKVTTVDRLFSHTKVLPKKAGMFSDGPTTNGRLPGPQDTAHSGPSFGYKLSPTASCAALRGRKAEKQAAL